MRFYLLIDESDRVETLNNILFIARTYYTMKPITVSILIVSKREINHKETW